MDYMIPELLAMIHVHIKLSERSSYIQQVSDQLPEISLSGKCQSFSRFSLISRVVENSVKKKFVRQSVNDITEKCDFCTRKIKRHDTRHFLHIIKGQRVTTETLYKFNIEFNISFGFSSLITGSLTS